MNNYGLNDEQITAIKAPSPTFVNASAGSGKTRCLVAKIQSLLDSGVLPESILAITFTNKAAEEMKTRLKSGSGNISRMQVSTIHSMCVRIIRGFIRYTYLKYPFSIYDDSDQLSVVKAIVKAKNLSNDPAEYLYAIGTFKCDGILPEQVENIPVGKDYKPLDNFVEVYNQYQSILKQNNACDFDDLLILAYGCLQHEDCQNYYSNLWKHILVDEFQDTSKIQYKIILSFYKPHITRTFFAVGDVNQSVYSWRGAYPKNVDNFIKDYKATVCFLTYNYRSSSEIVKHANIFQQFGKPMVSKSMTAGKVSLTEFSSIEDEAERIAQAIISMGDYNNTAIIYRINTRSIFFEQTFSRYRIPYKVVNELPFYQRKVCKDLLAALSAANNPDDRTSLARIINHPKRGFGDAKKVKLLEQGRSYLDTIYGDMPLIKSFMDLLNDIKGKNPSEAIFDYLNRSNYWETVEKDSDRYMIKAFQDVVVAFNNVEELILSSTFLERDSGDGVNLITAHGSKGLEFNRVFVVGLEEGLWPHANSKDIEEEFRLYYVATSRAKNYLNLSYSKSRNYRGTILSNSPSKLFLQSYQAL